MFNNRFWHQKLERRLTYLLRSKMVWWKLLISKATVLRVLFICFALCVMRKWNSLMWHLIADADVRKWNFAPLSQLVCVPNNLIPREFTWYLTYIYHASWISLDIAGLILCLQKELGQYLVILTSCVVSDITFSVFA